MNIVPTIKIQNKFIPSPRTKSVQSRADRKKILVLNNKNPKEEFIRKSPEHFTRYFYSGEKECQTLNFPSLQINENTQTNFEDFFKSHRHSIEKEVMSIFQGSQTLQKPGSLVKIEGLEAQKPETPAEILEPKQDNFKDLLKLAKHFRPTTPTIGKASPINISKARLGYKARVLPCNKFFSLKTNNIVFRPSTPKVRTSKIPKPSIVISNYQKPNRPKNIGNKDLLQKQRVIENRSQTPASVCVVKLEFKSCEGWLASPTVSPTIDFP
ncbi:hypothetical protein SteCoe_37006 [Stentor coeruleus]|uniref:Uncharacterized protein n=1 Tax=Stentor coeruleus TaxID=5963 RepID=A0A1R2ANZ5_9CILI|nr:hypothetical protein SteCoe_37006 [Stentor coeruleus]